MALLSRAMTPSALASLGRETRRRVEEARRREQARQQEEFRRIQVEALKKAQRSVEESRRRAEAQMKQKLEGSRQRDSSKGEWESKVQSVEEEAYRLGDKAYEWWYGSETD